MNTHVKLLDEIQLKYEKTFRPQLFFCKIMGV